MKKIIALMLLVCILFGLVACKTDVGQKNEIIQETKDDFSKYNMDYYEGISIVDGNKVEVEMNYAHYNTIEQLYDASDYVIVASPEETFEQSKQEWNDRNNKQTEDFSQADSAYSYTKRNLKVKKVYKGENLKLKDIIMCERIISQDTDMKIMLSGDYPLVKGEKYLLFLKESNSGQDMYFPSAKQGIYSLDSDKNTSNLEKQVKEMFKDEFEDK